jgi:thiol-disulfide isomerase/thioredoxin
MDMKIIKAVLGVVVLAVVILLASRVYDVLQEDVQVQELTPPPTPAAQTGAGLPGTGAIDAAQSLMDTTHAAIDAALEISDANHPNPKSVEVQDDRILAPDFSMLDTNGGTVTLSQHFGKPLVLNFWASWCPPCKAEMPDFEIVYQEMGEDVTFLMVNLTDPREPIATAQKFIEQEGYTFPVYFDTEGEAVLAYSIRSIPTTLFIDREGYIVTGAQGAISERALRMGIEMAVGEDEF